MWNAANFGSVLWNSLVISIGATILVIVVSVPAAYAIARFTFAFRQPFSQFLLATQMLCPIVLVLGLFHLVVLCGLIDSKYALILIYAAFNIAFAVWMLRSYFGSIPVELEEAALIDGCSRLAVSCPTSERAVIDAGSKTLSSDLLAPGQGDGYGLLPDYPDASIARLNEEHGVVELGRSARKPAVGERVRIIPNHVCVVTNLHDYIYLHRDGVVLAQLPVYLRGKTI